MGISLRIKMLASSVKKLSSTWSRWQTFCFSFLCWTQHSSSFVMDIMVLFTQGKAYIFLSTYGDLQQSFFFFYSTLFELYIYGYLCSLFMLLRDGHVWSSLCLSSLHNLLQHKLDTNSTIEYKEAYTVTQQSLYLNRG